MGIIAHCKVSFSKAIQVDLFLECLNGIAKEENAKPRDVLSCPNRLATILSTELACFDRRCHPREEYITSKKNYGKTASED